MNNVIVILFALIATTNQKLRFDNYSVYRITEQNEKQVYLINSVRNSHSNNNTIWDNIIDNDNNDMIVPPIFKDQFEHFLQNIGVTYEIITENVQELIENENPPFVKVRYEFVSYYHTLDEIYNYLEFMQETFPDKVEVVIGGRSYENREIKGVKLFPGENKPRIFFEGGMHAREWISTATVIFLIDQLLNSKRAEIVSITKEYEFYLFPSVNPDGYVFTHTFNRFWRKTRKPYGKCFGADPNRNFNFKWNFVGSSTRACSEVYSGSHPFSEIETQTLAKYILSIKNGLFAYISFHSYSQLLMFPYGYTETHLSNYNESLAIGLKAIRSLSKRYGTKYKVGNVAEILYPVTGSSMDWVKYTLNLPIVYVYELRDTGRHGFLLPHDQIVPTGLEITDSLITIFNEAKKYGY